MDRIGSTTLKDIAETLKISISTVSRALRNHPDVNQNTKEKVLKLAEELDYEPNELALGLLKGHSNLVAVMVPKVAYHLYATAITAIEHEVRKQGFILVTIQTHESMESEVTAVKELIKNRVAGFIVSVASKTGNFSHFELIKRKKIPLVFFNRDCEDIEASRVIIDNVGAAYKAVEHLYDQGYERIAYLGASALVQISNRRLIGYRKAIEAHGRNIIPEYEQHCDFDKGSVIKSIDAMMGLSQPPDAILAFSDQMAVSALSRLKELKIKIPEQFGVIGFNNEPTDELIVPSLSSIAQPAYEMGQITGDFLLRQIKEHKEEISKEILSTKLIIRNSTLRKK